MIQVNLAHLPTGHSHQEFEWELPSNVSGLSHSINITGVFDIYNKHNSDYEFSGYITYELPVECNRCGKEFNKCFREDIRFIVKRNSDIDDIDIISANSNIVNLMSYFRDIIITGIPMTNLCNECSDNNGI